MGIDNRNPDDAANDLASKVDALLTRRGSGSGIGDVGGVSVGSLALAITGLGTVCLSVSFSVKTHYS